MKKEKIKHRQCCPQSYWVVFTSEQRRKEEEENDKRNTSFIENLFLPHIFGERPNLYVKTKNVRHIGRYGSVQPSNFKSYYDIDILNPPIIENWVVPNYFSKTSVGTRYQNGW